MDRSFREHELTQFSTVLALEDSAMPHHATRPYATLRPLPVLTIDETASILGVERSTIYRLLRAGDLESVRVGQRQRIRPEDLDAYLERNREAATP